MEVSLGAEASGPLAGFRVIDLSTIVSGPLCTQILGDLGADVVKVEAPAGDTGRYLGLPLKDGMSPLFVSCNRNKRSIGVDLKSEAGSACVRRLVRDADVFLENFRPGVADRLGLSHATLAAENPRLIYVAISGFGPSGPYRDMPAYDTVIQGLSCFMPIQGTGEAPRLVQSIFADKATALTACNAVMAALLARERGGEDAAGQRIDIPMLDAFAAFLLPDILGPKTFPNDEAPTFPNVHRSWETADGHVVMMVVEDRQFFGMCEALGRADLIDDPRCANIAVRIANMGELFPILEAELKQLTTAEVVERGRKHGAPVSPVNDLDAFLADPQVAHNQTVFEVDDDPGLATMRMLRSPLRLSQDPPRVRLMPPRLGEHTDEILAEAGFSDGEIADLRSSGAVSG